MDGEIFLSLYLKNFIDKIEKQGGAWWIIWQKKSLAFARVETSRDCVSWMFAQ